MIPDRVVLSHPFSGSLYAFLSDELGATHTKSPSSYYRTLFGKDYQKLTDLALTLSVVYKTIVIPPVDIPLPEYNLWRTDYGYENKDLGILYHCPRDDVWYGAINELVKMDQNDPVICQILHSVPKHSWHLILRDTRYDIRLARTFQCPVLCSKGRRALIQRLIEMDISSGEIRTVGESAVKAVEEYVEITGLTFKPRSIEALHDLKTDKDLRSYADAFVSMIHGFRDQTDVRKQLLELMRDSINKSRIARSATGLFDGSSTVLGFLGLVPVPILAAISSIGGIATSGASFGAKQYQHKHEWYQLSSRIHETLTTKQIEKRIAKELNDLTNG